MISLKDIASHVDGRLVGCEDTQIRNVRSIGEAEEGSITFLSQGRYAKYVKDCKASAIIVGNDFPVDTLHGIAAVVVANPSLAYVKTLELLHPRPTRETGISQYALLSPESNISGNVSIGPYVHVGRNCVIKDNVTLHPFVCVGEKVTIDEGTTIYPHVTIYDGAIIGRNVTIHSGSIVGSDGFGYVWDGSKHVKIPHVGNVIIEDDVEIGANVTIDRGELDHTIIRKGTKIDNLVQIAHNVSIGENSIIIAQTGISGSAKIGRNVVLAGQTGVADHVSIGDGVMAGGRAGITGNVPAGSLISGTPHMPHKEWLRVNIYLKKLPRLFQRIRQIEKILHLEDVND